MAKFIVTLSIATLGMLALAPISNTNHTTPQSVTYYLHYESGSTDCTGAVYLDTEDYPDPGHRCAALGQQLEPTSWEPETFTPVKLDTSRQVIAQLAVTGAAFDSAALKIRLFGVRNDGQKILVGRASSSEFSSEPPQPTFPEIPEVAPHTQQVTLFFSLRQTAKDALFTTISLETDMMGFAPGAYVELDNPASSLTIPTLEPAAIVCSTPCITPRPTPST